ncbi:MAG: DUF3147 family protein [Candidatus Latescibacteria bacterium]|nr:DUF3147 family protein [Candidatus Latescibacterota bacterium]
MDPFISKLMLSFVVGGLWTVVGTVIAERAGTKAGGVIAGMPSAIVVALFFIGWTQSPEVASEATTLVPLVLGIIALFCVVYVLLYPRGFALAVTVGLAFWFAVSLGVVFAGVDRFSHSLIGFAILVPSCHIVFEKVLRIPSAGRRTVSPTWQQLLFRAILGGFIISFAVTMAKVGGPLIGGVFATFPTIMLSTMVINHFAHGPAFATSFIKTITLSGPINTTVYSTCVRYLYPEFGLAVGTGMSFVIALISGGIVYLFIRQRTS